MMYDNSTNKIATMEIVLLHEKPEYKIKLATSESNRLVFKKIYVN